MEKIEPRERVLAPMWLMWLLVLSVILVPIIHWITSCKFICFLTSLKDYSLNLALIFVSWTWYRHWRLGQRLGPITAELNILEKTPNPTIEASRERSKWETRKMRAIRDQRDAEVTLNVAFWIAGITGVVSLLTYFAQMCQECRERLF
jgi:hypothetical protein